MNACYPDCMIRICEIHEHTDHFQMELQRTPPISVAEQACD